MAFPVLSDEEIREELRKLVASWKSNLLAEMQDSRDKFSKDMSVEPNRKHPEVDKIRQEMKAKREESLVIMDAKIAEVDEAYRQLVDYLDRCPPQST